MSEFIRPRPIVLCILDGFGIREESNDNAVTRASTPHFRQHWNSSPHALLHAAEEHVGLPKGQIGNSEVGHMNLGAGRIVVPSLPMIDRAIAEGQLATNPVLREAIGKLRQSGGTCHLMGLVSPGGVHSHQDHIVALASEVTKRGVPVAVHAFLDGRDVPPKSAIGYVTKFQDDLAKINRATLSTLCGRYFAMDRDDNWDRVAIAYDLLTVAKGTKAADPVAAIEASYASGKTDEFMLPVVLGGYKGMKDGDGVLFGNFRTDRPRRILRALLEKASFDCFERIRTVRFEIAAGMMKYSDHLASPEHMTVPMTALFQAPVVENSLGEVLSRAGLRQLRLAETEKYAHVTSFFNGQRDEKFEGETWEMVPSPKVESYSLKPEMSAQGVTDKVVGAIHGGGYDVIVMNYANPDMVGHTGDLSAAIRAVESVDASLGRLFAAVKERSGVLLLTADHGNCETMYDAANNCPHTAHTLERVPVMLVNAPEYVRGLKDGILADVAPTLLDIMRLPKPPQMTGRSLIVPAI